jgi:MFS family permease
VGAIVGPLAVGALSDYVSYFGGFVVAAALMVVAGGVFLFMFETEPAPEAPSGALSHD